MVADVLGFLVAVVLPGEAHGLGSDTFVILALAVLFHTTVRPVIERGCYLDVLTGLLLNCYTI